MKTAAAAVLAVALGPAFIPVRAGTEPPAAAGRPAEGGHKVPVTTSSPEALKNFLTGRDLLEKLRGRDSKPYFEWAVEADRGFAMGYLYLSFVESNTARARTDIDVAVALSDHVSDGERLWIAGFKAGADGFPLQERSDFEKLVQMYPDDERVRTLLGNTCFEQQDYEAAIQQYEKAVALAPDYSPPYNQLGYAYSFQGDYARAEKILRKYIKLIPDDPNPYDSYGELLMKMGKYDESIAAYRKALKVHPGFMPSHVGIASDYNLKGEYIEAREQLETLYAEAQDDGDRRMAHFATAVSYIEEGDVARGLEQLMKRYALAERSGDTVAMAGDLVLIGNVLLETGKVDEAAAWYGKAVKKVRDSHLPPGQKARAERFHLYNSARVDLAKNDVAAAKTKYEEFVRQVEASRGPDQLRLTHQLGGMIALADDDYELAVQELGRANRQDPYNLYRMARAFEGLGEWDKAAELCDRAVSFNGITNLNTAFSRNRAKNLRAELSERQGLERKVNRPAPGE